MITLPIESVLPQLLSVLSENSSAVLSADPGAGKTTRVPVALLEASWLIGKKVIMLEPRRLAAQRAAHFMASQLGERVGQTVGYRIRGDARVSPATKIEIVTEGILTRMVQNDPGLPDAGVLIFDEFHERSIHADVGLAFALDVQLHLRPDMRVLLMSATLDTDVVSRLLGGAPVVRCLARSYPVTTHYLPRRHESAIEPLVVATIKRALRDVEGDILAFLPGQREIRRVESLLFREGVEVPVHALFGDAPMEQQYAALTPDPSGRQKIILSTSIAETSLTIDGVRAVIDSGLARGPRFDPRRGMSGLVTMPVSQASADQRRGRGGRQAPGVCFRLWTEEQHTLLPGFSTPEILAADLAPLALEFARWGAPDGEGLRFLDPPPPAHLNQAKSLLRRLAAVDAAGRLTSHGRAMSELPVHPRLAHMMLRGKKMDYGGEACDVAALLEERDLGRGERAADIDFRARWHLLKEGRRGDRSAIERIRAQAERYRQMLGVRSGGEAEDKVGILLALAYPERIAKKRGDRFQLAGGPVAVLPPGSLLARESFLAVADVDGAGSEVKVFLAAPLPESDVRTLFSDQTETTSDIRWDESESSVVARRVTRLGAIELSESPLPPDEHSTRATMMAGIRHMGIACLPWSSEARSLRDRSEWLRQRHLVPAGWPDLSDEALLRSLEDWLGPFLRGITRRTHLERLSLVPILRSLFSHVQRKDLDRLAPTHLSLPSGSRHPVEYGVGSQPVLAVRLQEMFGETESPRIADGQVRVLLHLLSPARRPLAVTQDLASFWRNSYPEIRKEMRGRYPRHPWPENPLTAIPTSRKKERRHARH